MKKKIFIYSFIIVFILISISLGFVFAINKNSSESGELTTKAEEEIRFIEDKIIAMMNKLNNINFLNGVLTKGPTKSANSKDNTQTGGSESKKSSQTSQADTTDSGESESSKSTTSNNSSSSNENTKYEVKTGGILISSGQPIDWEYMKANAESLYSFSPTLVSDLNSLNVNSDDILKFSSTLDQVILSVKNEDKLTTLNNLASLHAFLPKYREQISKDSTKINIDYTKNCILNSYAIVEQNNWTEVKSQVTNALNYYSNVIGEVDTSKSELDQNRISKSYILLNELNTSVDIQDKDLYYIKYRNLIEELINL